jgi:hypothetical protein
MSANAIFNPLPHFSSTIVKPPVVSRLSLTAFDIAISFPRLRDAKDNGPLQARPI